MPSHQDRVKQNYCKHEINTGLIYSSGRDFVADCTKCGKKQVAIIKPSRYINDPIEYFIK